MSPPEIFDRRRIRTRRTRGARTFADHDFLHERALADITDRLESANRTFERALFYGATGPGFTPDAHLTPGCGVDAVIYGDLSEARLDGAHVGVVHDEDASPFAPGSFDLIVSLLTLHTVNDLVGALVQMRLALKPDGLLIATLFGEETLNNVRRDYVEAECEIHNGAGARFAPMASVRDLGGALQRAGFSMPVADLDSVDVAYRDPARLIADLRGMGETAPLASGPAPLSRAAAARAAEHLSARGGAVRFDIVTLTGWAPHEAQPKPLKPGSASASLAAAVLAEKK